MIVACQCIFHPTSKLPKGRLPLLRQVLSFTLECHDVNSAAMDIMLHWVTCNVYTQSRKTVTKKVDKHKTELFKLHDFPISKKGATYWQRLACFVQESNKLFDIKGSPVRINAQEQIWSVKMSPAEHTFENHGHLKTSRYLNFLMLCMAYQPNQG